jgi:hypothetical protein
MNKTAWVIVLSAVAATASSPAAFAETEYRKVKRIEHEDRDIRRDTRDIRADRADIRRDRAELRDERHERNYDFGRELKAFAHGNFGAAKYWDYRRRQEQHNVNAIKGDVRRDRADLIHDDLDRNVDVLERNYDARKL